MRLVYNLDYTINPTTLGLYYIRVVEHLPLLLFCSSRALELIIFIRFHVSRSLSIHKLRLKRTARSRHSYYSTICPRIHQNLTIHWWNRSLRSLLSLPSMFFVYFSLVGSDRQRSIIRCIDYFLFPISGLPILRFEDKVEECGTFKMPEFVFRISYLSYPQVR